MSFNQQLLNDVSTFLQTHGKAVKLDSYNLQKYTSDAVCGWEVELASHLTIALCLTREFPSERLPITFLKGHDNLSAKYLHVEENGKLCLDIKLDDLILDSELEIIKATLQSAKRLVEGLQEISVDDSDYQNEFKSYWALENGRFGIYSILSVPAMSPANIHYINLEDQTAFFDEEEAGLAWVNSFLGKETKKFQSDRIEKAVFVHLKELPHPSEFPSNGRELMSLAKKKGFDNELKSVIETQEKVVTVIFEFVNNGEPYYFSTSVNKKQPKKIKGFRKKHIPPEIDMQECFGIQKTYVTPTVRVDAGWIHQRGGSVTGGFHDNHVIIVGCGSLGCQVALQLAQSGVNLTLIDDDLLLSENTARHLLGGQDYLFKNKAVGLRLYLTKMFPHLTIKAIDKKAQNIVKNDKHIFLNSDLVVNTTGSGVAEVHLGLLGRKDPKMPPVIFGWTEPHAIAGQLLIVQDKGGCYFCEMQTRRYKVTKWAESQEKTDPGCGAYYQPYGAVDMAPIQAMVSRACLEVLNGQIERSEVRTWVGDISMLSSLGGELNQMWLGKNEELCFREFKEDLPQHAECKLCKPV